MRRPRRRRPLIPEALTALAATLKQRHPPRGSVVFHGGQPASGVWIVQQGRVELSVGSGRRRTVIHILRSGDVDGDIQLLLDMPPPYTARALDDATLL
jgi:CRP/FNR family transcriptional regulator, cAMP and macrophage regulator